MPLKIRKLIWSGEEYRVYLFHHEATGRGVLSVIALEEGEFLERWHTVCFQSKDEDSEDELHDAQWKHEVESHIAG
jgi:hypothetical protein